LHTGSKFRTFADGEKKGGRISRTEHARNGGTESLGRPATAKGGETVGGSDSTDIGRRGEQGAGDE